MVIRFICIVFCTFITPTILAQSLDDRVRELELRVEQLEKQNSKPSSVNNPTKSVTNQQEGWRSKENWRSLQRGMKEADVRSILGEPQTIDTHRSFSAWTYPGGGDTNFDSDGSLTGWREPR